MPAGAPAGGTRRALSSNAPTATSGISTAQLYQKHTENAKEVDKPIAGLLKDLKARGMLKDTLVIWAGEFGRTPVSQGNDGRDHNPYGYSIWMAGRRREARLIYGATDDIGYHAVEDRMHIHDFHATVAAPVSG